MSTTCPTDTFYPFHSFLLTNEDIDGDDSEDEVEVVIGSCKLLRMAWLVAINNAQIAGRRAYQSFSFLTGKGAFLHATDVYSSGLYGSSRMFNRFWRGWISFFKRIRFSDEWGFAYQHIIGPITDLKRCPWFALQLSPILGIVKINLHDAAAACTSYLVQ